jgi:simple sugar transport system permease protein
VPLFWWLVYRTSFGLQLRAVGENPEAADAAGVSVFFMRYLALGIAGGLMAAGGSFLSLAQLGSFIFGIIAGRGWVCIALIIFANWHPVRVFWGALLFGEEFYPSSSACRPPGMDSRMSCFSFALPGESHRQH